MIINKITDRFQLLKVHNLKFMQVYFFLQRSLRVQMKCFDTYVSVLNI